MLKSLLVSREAVAAPITIKGDFFFYPNGTQFFVRGVNLDTARLKILNNVANCAEHISALLALHINTALAAANIYVVVELSFSGDDFTSEYTLNAWDLDMFAEFTSTVKSFANHTNVIGFTMGSNVMEIHGSEQNALPFLKAAMRDMRAYMVVNGYRPIPLGISAPNYSFNSDIAENFLSCGSISESVDFWAVRLDWCDNSYGNLTSTYRSYGIPVIVGENRCSNTLDNNTFPEIATLYGPSLTPIFSGGFLRPYFFIPDTNTDNGLVNIIASSSLNEIASNFSVALGNAKPVALQSDSYTPTDNQVKACLTIDPVWVNYQTLPLEIVDGSTEICKCMYDNLKCQAMSNFGSGDHAFWNMTQFQKATIMTGVVANSTESSYGPFSMCNGYQRASWVLNRLYLEQVEAGANPSCDLITNERANPDPSMTSRCKDLLAKYDAIGNLIDTPLDGGNGDSLSPGAIAGIVVGVVFVVSALIGAAIFFWRRRKRQQKVRSMGSESSGGMEVGTETETKDDVKHLNIELAADEQRMSELWAAREIVELPGSDGLQKTELHTESSLSTSDIKNRGAYIPIQTVVLENAEDPPDILVPRNGVLDSRPKESRESITAQTIATISPQVDDGRWGHQEGSDHVVSPVTELTNGDNELKRASTPKPPETHP